MKKKGNAYWLEGGKSAVARKVGNKMEEAWSSQVLTEFSYCCPLPVDKTAVISFFINICVNITDHAT